MKLILVVLGLASVALATQVRFDNFQVHRIIPTTESQVQALRELQENNVAYNFWSGVEGIEQPVDIMIPPHLINDFQDFLSLQQLTSEVFIDNVQDRIDNEKPKVQSRAFGWTDYYRLNDIYAWLDSIVAEFPNVVTPVVGGSSYEGRQIRGVRVSYSSANRNRTVFVEAGIHAREWITNAVSTYILNQLLRSSDSRIRAIAQYYDWYFFPSVNPDGYEYSHTTNRMWRKTRTPYGSCYGADPNRNWGYRWNTGGASTNPCSDTFAGPNPFSERSTSTLSQFFTGISSQTVAYISFHSYSQLLLIPYGHTTQNLDNYAELKQVGDRAAAALASRFGTRYTVGNIAATIYVATGGSMDWAKGTYGTRITYTYELRDQGRYGFVLPADQIIPTGQETLDSFVVIFEEFLGKL
uniref:Zinc carboxypeptidase A 1 n=1 Tax=Oryctes rhinoceros TaxID=72550 RepID=A0A5C0C9H0_ORYRH|nr:putative zinc carboxypeptidase [Oryctes rhinoceros]